MKASYEWIKKVFERIPELVVTLENDTSVLGPVYLREKLVQCRTYLNEVHKFYQTVKEDMWELVRNRDIAQTDYNIQLDKLLAEDDEVRRQPSHKDRIAVANQKLKLLIDEIGKAEVEIRDLSALEEVLKLKLKDLKDANSDIRTAKQLMIAELKLGAFFGDDNKPKDNPAKLLEGVKDTAPEDLINEVTRSEREDLDDLFTNL